MVDENSFVVVKCCDSFLVTHFLGVDNSWCELPESGSLTGAVIRSRPLAPTNEFTHSIAVPPHHWHQDCYLMYLIGGTMNMNIVGHQRACSLDPEDTRGFIPVVKVVEPILI